MFWYSNKGFSLIEMMVAMVIVSVGMLALGSFYLASIQSEGVSQQRLSAVHMAEQILEGWQHTNVITLDCLGVAQEIIAVPQPGAVTRTGCKAAEGTPVSFDIVASQRAAQAPLATPGGVVMGNLVDNYANVIPLRSVKVSWVNNGKTRFVLLTHIRQR